MRLLDAFFALAVLLSAWVVLGTVNWDDPALRQPQPLLVALLVLVAVRLGWLACAPRASIPPPSSE